MAIITYLLVPTLTSAAIAISGTIEGTTYYTIASNYSATALIDFTYAATTGSPGCQVVMTSRPVGG